MSNKLTMYHDSIWKYNCVKVSSRKFVHTIPDMCFEVQSFFLLLEVFTVLIKAFKDIDKVCTVTVIVKYCYKM